MRQKALNVFSSILVEFSRRIFFREIKTEIKKTVSKKTLESDVTPKRNAENFVLSDICRIHFHIRSNAGIM